MIIYNSILQQLCSHELKEPENDKKAIGYSQIFPGFCIKTRLSAQPLIWKRFFILRQIKLIFTRKDMHLFHVESEGFWNSEVAC